MNIRRVLDLIYLSSLKSLKWVPWIMLTMQSKTCPVNSVQDWTLELPFKRHFAWRSCGSPAVIACLSPWPKGPPQALLTTDTPELQERKAGMGGRFKGFIRIRKPEFISLLLRRVCVTKSKCFSVGIHVSCIYLSENCAFVLSQVLHYLHRRVVRLLHRYSDIFPWHSCAKAEDINMARITHLRLLITRMG